MPKTTTQKPTTKKATKRQRATKKDQLSEDVPSIQDLREMQKTQVAQYNTVKNTATAYKGYVARGRKFLQRLVAKHQKGEGDADLPGEDIPIDELEKAFDKPPNRWSALALELYIVEKCYNEGYGESTADGIHGAFAELWDTM